MSTSTGSTVPKDLLHNGFSLTIKPPDYLESEELKKLIFAFEDDLKLRNFFIRQTFSGLSSGEGLKGRESVRYQYFFDFIRESRLLPKTMPGKFDSRYYSYFSSLSSMADQVFLKTINRSLAHICEKAEEIGLLTPDIYIDSVSHRAGNFQRQSILNIKITNYSLCGSQLNLKSLMKEVTPPSASKFLPLSAKEILKKRRLKTLRKLSSLFWK